MGSKKKNVPKTDFLNNGKTFTHSLNFKSLKNKLVKYENLCILTKEICILLNNEKRGMNDVNFLK